MNSLKTTTWRDRCVAMAVATVASIAVLSASLWSFAEVGRTPWFGAESEFAEMVQGCQAEPASTERHRCVRQMAAIADAQGASAPVRVAGR